jgi:hypothetical protein
MTAHIENTREFDLTTQDGTRLFVRDWPLAPNGDQLPPGVLLMHGLGEHCGRYAHIARFLMPSVLLSALMTIVVMANPLAMPEMSLTTTRY